jgi:hypothetical protein
MRKMSQRKSQMTTSGARRRGNGRASSNGEEAGLEQLDFPAVRIPELADVHDRHVKHPQQQEQEGVRITRENYERQRHAQPRHDLESAIRNTEPEDAGKFREALEGRAKVFGEPAQIRIRGQQAVVPDQRHELIRGDQECDEVDESERAKNDEAGQPVTTGSHRTHVRSERRGRDEATGEGTKIHGSAMIEPQSTKRAQRMRKKIPNPSRHQNP